MEVFYANDRLVEVLQKGGLIETTTNRDVERLQRVFRPSIHSKKHVCFVHEKILLTYKKFIHDEKTSLTEDELKLLFFFFKLPTSDIKELCGSSVFTFKKAAEGISKMQAEMLGMLKFDANKGRRSKYGRLLKIYDEIEI